MLHRMYWVPMDVDKDGNTSVAAATVAASTGGMEVDSSAAMMNTETEGQNTRSSAMDWSTFMKDEQDAEKRSRIVAIFKTGYKKMLPDDLSREAKALSL